MKRKRDLGGAEQRPNKQVRTNGDEPAAQAVRKRGRPKKAVMQDATHQRSAESLGPSTTATGRSKGEDTTSNLGVHPGPAERDAGSAAWKILQDDYKAVARKRGRPKKADVTVVRNTKCSEDAPDHFNQAHSVKETAPAPRQPLPVKEERPAPVNAKRVDRKERLKPVTGTPLDDDAEAETRPRPRRRAAAAAMVRVTEGLIEEDQPIDKKRRPEPEGRETKRPSVEKTLPATAPGASVISSKKLALPKTMDERCDKSVVEKKLPRETRRRAQPRPQKHLVSLTPQRMPLAEVGSNAQIRSVSPEKRMSGLKRQAPIEESVPPTSAKEVVQEQALEAEKSREVVKRSDQSEQLAKRKLGRALPKTTTAQLENGVQDRDTTHGKSASQDIDLANKQKTRAHSAMASGAEEVRSTSGQISAPSRKDRSAAVARHREDLKGLLEGPRDKQERPPSKKRPTTASRRAFVSYNDDVDLDDLLSNIASLAAAR